MANLGDNNTPVEGESFGLPSGYAVDEENGDLVIRDTDGTVVMRRADGAAWQLEGSDISGVGAFDSESVNTDELGIAGTGTLLSADQDVAYAPTTLNTDIGSTTSTSFVELASGSGFVPISDLPDGATLYGRQWARASVDTDGESGTVRPRLWEGFATGSVAELDELDLVFDSTTVESKDTGWIEITSLSQANDYIFDRQQGRVTGGELSFSGRIPRPAPIFAWRIE